MRRIHRHKPLRHAIPTIFFLVFAAHLYAQTSLRPGSASRGTIGSAGRTTGSTGLGGIGSSSNSSSTNSTGQRQYRSNTLLGDAVIQVDPETRSIIVVTDEDTHNELEKVIVDLDRPKPQVLIKVVFLEVTYDKSSDIGVEGSYTFNLKSPTAAAPASTSTTTTTSNSSNTTGSASATGGTTTTGTTTNVVDAVTNAAGVAGLGRTINLSNLSGLSALTTGSFLRLASDDWSATLHALVTHGKVEVLSRPTIMARNNQQAVIIVGQEVPFVTNSRVTDTGQTINSVSYDNVGIILSVTPFITNNNMVEMIVAPEISALTDQTVAISNTASSPVISKRSAETVVVTPDGTTSVIGGLMQTQKTSTITKIPILGDIPYLGLPFRRTIKGETKTELLIFLTPYIVHTADDLQSSTADEASRAELMHKAFSEKDLSEFLQATKLDPRPNSDTTPAKKTEVRRATPANPTVSSKSKTTTTTRQPF
jgi:general secretion pathway protein D